MGRREVKDITGNRIIVGKSIFRYALLLKIYNLHHIYYRLSILAGILYYDDDLFRRVQNFDIKNFETWNKKIKNYTIINLI